MITQELCVEVEDMILGDDSIFDTIENYLGLVLEKEGILREDVDWTVSVCPANNDHVDPQLPMCDHYPPGPAVACWPSGVVQKFPSLAKAKTLLMRQHIMYVYNTPYELFNLYHENADHWKDVWKLTDEDVLNLTPPFLWDYVLAIAKERDPWMNAGDIPDGKKLSKRATAAGYIVSQKKCTAFDAVKAPKQAKVIALSLLQYEDGSVVSDEDITKLLMQAVLNEVLKTSQPVQRIFAYYRPLLLQHECITLRN